jgi:hypothetical protein
VHYQAIKAKKAKEKKIVKFYKIILKRLKEIIANGSVCVWGGSLFNGSDSTLLV